MPILKWTSYFSQSVSGAEWVAGGGNVNDAVAGPDDINDWTIWQLRPNISKLIWRGGARRPHAAPLGFKFTSELPVPSGFWCQWRQCFPWLGWCL